MARHILVVCLALAAVAYWAPWVGHAASALQLSGQDLGEFVKFIPEIRTGRLWFPRQVFYLPPFICLACFVLLAANRGLGYARWLRVAMLLAALLLLPSLLPPAWGRFSDLFTPEFRLQGAALACGLVLVLSHGAFRGVPPAALRSALIAMAFVALVPPQITFWVIRPRIWASYGTPTVRVGWGVWLDIGAWVGIAVAAGAMARPSRGTS